MPKWVLTLLFAAAQCLQAQSFVRPGQLPPKSQWPAELVEHFGVSADVLVSALNRRAAAISNFEFPQVNAGWSLLILELNDNTYIFGFTPPAGSTFLVQAIMCEKKTKFIDYSMLGPTETAAEFYDANLGSLMSTSDDDINDYVTCGGTANLMGGISSRTTELPGLDYVTSEDRVIRHLCAWLDYFHSGKGKNLDRAADFLATTLDKEKAHLLALESEKSYKDVVNNLTLFDKQFPADGFDRSLPLDADARARIRSYLETAIRIRGKLKPFIPDADSRIAKDEALLARFR